MASDSAAAQPLDPHQYSALAISLYYSVAKDNVNWDNVVPVCIELATALENIRNINGAFRLQILQEVLLIALNRSNVIDDQKKKLLLGIYQTVPLIVQGVVLASKNPIIQEIEEKAGGCCGRRKRA